MVSMININTIIGSPAGSALNMLKLSSGPFSSRPVHSGPAPAISAALQALSSKLVDDGELRARKRVCGARCPVLGNGTEGTVARLENPHGTFLEP
ncbi:hypothetical protein PF001_g15689 [Phytophthora fragariae]|uniref:Uncharacterized protein n=1 Tax=Phytophthora fragariae TaxID=53985 RepID=A0A6A4CYD8_9STRA|nr:hypothetical protein PF004_g19223 [Phytophthora fragariae]KAE9298925.1 hypothetical protein PF001_g15689 [Phytophthora fragariae]